MKFDDFLLKLEKKDHYFFQVADLWSSFDSRVATESRIEISRVLSNQTLIHLYDYRGFFSPALF